MKLYAHQIKGLKQTEGHPNCALYWDMGLGKTFGGSEKMMSYGNDTNLVICQKSKVNDWVDHFKEHYPRTVVRDLTKRGAVDEFTSWYTVWHGWHGASTTVAVINYELAWRRKDLLNLKDFTLMLDESSLIQNKTAKQTKFILKLKPKNVILLSGTPTAGKYENLWSQCHLLGWNISEALYNRQYVNWKTIESDGFYHKIVDKDNPYKNVERLKQKLRDHGAVFMKTEEVFDLPEQTFTMVKMSTSKEYRRFMKHSIVDVGGIQLIGDQIFTKRLYARQLCGIYHKDRVEAFAELLQSTNDRVVVFYNFNGELEAIKGVCEAIGRPYSQVNGSVKDLTAYEEKNDSVTICQYQAAAMGLNLQKANKLIYFSLPERSELFEQSKARIHRIGQERPCFYWVMMCDKSVEEDIYQTLLERKDYTDDLFIQKY